MDAVPLIDLISFSLVVIAMIMQTASLDGSLVTESSASPDVNTTTMPTSSSSSLMGIDRSSITQSRANHTFIIPASPATTNISLMLPNGATEGSDITATITTLSNSTIVSSVWSTRDTNEGATTLSPGVDNSTVIMSTDSKSVGNWGSSTEMGNFNSTSWTLNTTRRLVDVTLRDRGMSDAMVATAHPTLDKSFSTNEFWVVMELAVAMNTHIHDAVYLRHLEGSLARGFNTARKRKEAKDWEIAQLLEKLDTEGDIPLRKRRASTVEGSTAQIIDLSRNADDPSIGELVFYISRGGAGIPATDCAATLTELSVQELTLIMGIVVLSAVSSFNPVPTMVPQSAGPSRTLLLALLIPLSALLAFLCCCCLCCTLCGPKRKKNQRVMTPDTFKMLEFKQKFPYKPYHPNVTHVEDLRQRSEADNADQESSGEDGSVDTTSKTQIIPMDGTDHQRAPLGYSDAEGVVNEGLDGTTRTSEIPDPSSCDPVEKEGQLPPLPSTQRTNKQYTEEQKRISEILEPEKIPKRTQKKRRRRNSVGAVRSTKQRGNLSGMNTRKQGLL